MEYFLKWIRYFIWGFLGLLVLLITLLVVLDWDVERPDDSNIKQVEIERSFIRGFDGNMLRWQAEIGYKWAGRSQYLFRGEIVREGIVFDDKGAVILDHIRANHLKVNSKSKSITAQGTITLHLKGRDGRGAVLDVSSSNISQDVIIRADYAKYYDYSQRAFIEGNVRILQGDTGIYPSNRANYDREKNLLYVEEGVVVRTKDFVVNADELIIHLDDGRAYLKGDIQGQRLQKAGEGLTFSDDREARLSAKVSYFSCDELFYYANNDNQVEVELKGNVSVFQDDKRLSGGHGIFKREDNTFLMTKNAVFFATNLEWMLDPNRNSGFSNPEMNESVSATTNVTCHSFFFDATTGALALKGDVKIEQEKLNVTTRSLTYDDTTGLVVLDEYVFVERDGNEDLEAKGLKLNVYTEDIDIKGRFKGSIVIE